MDCTHAKDRLVELVYGELSALESAAVMGHVESCEACRLELAGLRRARRAMELVAQDAPPMRPMLLPVERQRPAGAGGDWRPASTRMNVFPLRIRRTLTAMAAIAAVVVLALAAYLARLPIFPDIATPAAAAMGDVEIKPVGLSLTIMSEPANWAPDEDDFAAGQMMQSSPRQVAYAHRPAPAWGGLALVRDQRIIANLPKGVTQVSFTNVPMAVDATSVRLRSLDAPQGLTILEQNYQYDLASSWAVLDKYRDKDITVSFKDGPAGVALAGRLLSFDDASLVLDVAQSGPRTIQRDGVRAISFARLPEGLLVKPTLVWKLDNQAASKQQFEVAYLTGGLKWRADYVLKLRAAKPALAGNMRGQDAPATRGQDARDTATSPAERMVALFDTADIVGYATVANRSGVSFKDAQLKLMAGDVNLIRKVKEVEDKMLGDPSGGAKNKLGDEQFAEKSFFEYHLYTLNRPTSLADQEVKQLEILTAGGISMRREYVFDPAVDMRKVRVVSEFRNTKENGLGKALPKGLVRLYAPDPEGEDAYVSEMEIDHTPVNEKVRLAWGFAFDLLCDMKAVDRRNEGGGDKRELWLYSLSSAKAYDATVTIIARVPATTKTLKFTGADGKEMPWHVREVGWVEAKVPVPAGQEVKVTLDLVYNDKNGGGLVSPHGQIDD